jgi:hypothetical protein
MHSPLNYWSRCCATGPSSPGKAISNAAAEHTLVVPGLLDVPFPRTWPAQVRADFDLPVSDH